MGEFIQYMIIGISVGMVYGLIALGVVLIWKSTAVFNFAHGDVVVIGGYAMWTLYVYLGINVWIAIALSIVIAISLGFLIQLCFRPLIGEQHMTMIILTFGLAFLLKSIYLMGWGGGMYTLPGFMPTGTFRFGDVAVSQLYVVSFAISAVVFIILALFLRLTKMGLNMRATAGDQRLAQSIGIRVTSVFAVAWMMGIAVACISGIVMTTLVRVSPQLAVLTLKAIPVVILGGMESIPGCLVGGFIIGCVESLTSGYLTPVLGVDVGEVAPFVVMILFLLVRPYGLFGLKTIERV